MNFSLKVIFGVFTRVSIYFAPSARKWRKCEWLQRWEVWVSWLCVFLLTIELVFHNFEWISSLLPVTVVLDQKKKCLESYTGYLDVRNHSSNLVFLQILEHKFWVMLYIKRRGRAKTRVLEMFLWQIKYIDIWKKSQTLIF